jgi:uncharacterized phage protein gp47/JayE
MTFNRPSLSAIAARVRSDFSGWLVGGDSWLRASVLDVLGRVIAGVSNALHGHIDWTAKQILPDTAESEILARRASIWLPEGRKPATAANGFAQAGGSDGTIIPAGTLLVRSDGQRYTVQQAVQIIAGVAVVAIEAELAGVQGNGPAAQLLTLSSPIAGINSVMTANAPGLQGGAPEESDADLLARLLFRMRNPPHGGNQSDYVLWGLEVPEVTRVWVYPNWLGPASVGLAFVMDGRASSIPLIADVDRVQAHVDLVRPVTADVSVFSPLPIPLNLSIAAQPPTPEVEAAIRAEITDMLYREAQPGGTILISHIREAISIAPGEHDHQLISPVADMRAQPGEMFVMGSITWA